jgi:hypothetical protein
MTVDSSCVERLDYFPLDEIDLGFVLAFVSEPTFEGASNVVLEEVLYGE